MFHEELLEFVKSYPSRRTCSRSGRPHIRIVKIRQPVIGRCDANLNLQGGSINQGLGDRGYLAPFPTTFQPCQHTRTVHEAFPPHALYSRHSKLSSAKPVSQSPRRTCTLSPNQ